MARTCPGSGAGTANLGDPQHLGRPVAGANQGGYDDTTCDEIAAAAGVSTRAFFRYFDTKDDVVMPDRIGEHSLSGVDLAAAMLTRPIAESPVESLLPVIREPLEQLTSETNPALRRYRVMMSTPSLQPLRLEYFHDIETAMAEMMTTRRQRPLDDLPTRLLAATVTAAFRLVFERWITDGARPNRLWPEIDEAMSLVSRAFGALQPATRT